MTEMTPEKVVWKVPLDELTTEVTLPDGSYFLHFDVNPRPNPTVRGMRLAAWFFVDPQRPGDGIKWNLVITATGEYAPQVATHLGTVVVEQYAWHLWRMPDEHMERYR